MFLKTFFEKFRIFWKVQSCQNFAKVANFDLFWPQSAPGKMYKIKFK